MTTVAGYSRISVAKDESTSLEVQQHIINARAFEYGMEVTHYVDDGFSGSKEDLARPAYDLMVAAILAGKHKVLVAKSVDRLGRRVLGLAQLLDLCEKAGCRVVIVDQMIDSTNDNGTLMAGLFASLAQMEAVAISNRQFAGQARRRELGRATSLAPFGFQNVVRDGGSWREKHPEEARWIYSALSDVIGGHLSLNAVADRWNANGLISRRGNIWNASTIRAVLVNPAICGMRTYQNESVKGPDGLPIIDEHLQILTVQEWTDLQASLSSRGGKFQGERHDRLMLHGLAHCGSCGGILTRSSISGGQLKPGVKYPVYRCGGAIHKTCTEPVTIMARKLDDYIEDLMVPFMDAFAPHVYLIEDPLVKAERALLNSEIASLGGRIMAADGDEMDELYATMKGLKGRLAALPTDSQVTVTLDRLTVGEYYVDDPRKAIDLVFTSITVARSPGTTKPPIEDRVTYTLHPGMETGGVVEWEASIIGRGGA